MKKLYDLLGGRKLVLGFIVIAIGVAMDLLTPNGLSSNLLYLLCFISTSFFLANAAVTASYSKNGNSANETAQSALDATNTKLDAVQGQVNQVVNGIATVQQAISYIIDKTGLNKK